MTSFNTRVEEKALRVRHLESVEKHLRNRASALIQEANDLMNERTRLRTEIQEMLEDQHIDKVKGSSLDVILTKSAPKLIVTDENQIPQKYKRVEVKLNRKAMIQDKDMGNIPGIRFVQDNVIIIKNSK